MTRQTFSIIRNYASHQDFKLKTEEATATVCLGKFTCHQPPKKLPERGAANILPQLDLNKKTPANDE